MSDHPPRVSDHPPGVSDHSHMQRAAPEQDGGVLPPTTSGIGLLDFYGSEEADLSMPRYDSRTVTPGDTFVAITGLTQDGHDHIAQAIERGAATIVLERDAAFTRDEAATHGVHRLLVRNTRRALAELSEIYFGHPSRALRLIGVTGTNGKTTVTHLIRQLLEARGERTGLIGTVGIEIGHESLPATHTTPESRDLSELLALMVQRGVTTCIMEVSSHALALDRVAALDYDIAVFTNLTRDHLDFHHTMEAYAAAKKRLFDGLKDTAIAVVNADDPAAMLMIADTVANAHTFGLNTSADLVGHLEPPTARGIDLVIEKRYSDESARFEAPLIGAFNASNLLAAVGALYFGVEGETLQVLSERASALRAPRGRFETVPLPGGVTAIVDYAHTPDALENVLRTLHSLEHHGRIVTVFGCGGDRDRTKRPLMGAIAAEHSDAVILTSDNPRSEDPNAIITEIERGIPTASRSRVTIEPDRAAAIARAIRGATAGDLILIAGKGHETYQIIGSVREHFDDREVLLRFASERG